VRHRWALRWSAVGVVALLALSGCGASSHPSTSSTQASAAKPPRYPAGTAMSGKLPSSLTHLAFTDQDGKTVHLADFAGKTVVIQDVMTLCQELCPIDTSTLVAAATAYAQSAPDPSKVVFLSITVDPQRDVPAQLAAYRKDYVGAATNLPQWKLLTGSAADVAALWKYLGVWVKKVPQDEKVTNWRTGQPLTYDVDHSDQAFFIDGTGNERYILDGMPSLGGAKIPPALQRFMTAEGHHNEMKDKGWTAAQALGVLGWLTGAQA
jgi:cytochrome oxidase Cu insertion factor (SCO1/SenC/PrrC family)